MEPQIRLGLLGSPQITFRGQIVRGFHSRKALLLLCYLAVRAQRLSRTHLADLFWRDKSEAQGRANLSRALNNLTALFPNAFYADRDTLTLDADAFVSDCGEFESFAAQGTAEALQAAAALYRGEFLAEAFLDDCPEFEMWLTGQRARWRQRIVSTLENLIEHYARRDAPAKALSVAARLLDLEPWREEAHREIMRLLAQTGQRSAALQQYETARRVLAEELGVEPDSETTELYRRIRAQEFSPPAPSAPRHNLPTPLTAFIGRETELARITTRLNNPECRLLTLVGTGGIGKTRLALQAARELLGSFRDGVCFVALAPLGVGRVEMIVPTIASALELRLTGQIELKTQLLASLRDKRTLLLLDNFEHLLDGTELVVDLLRAAPQVKILVTSLEPLDVQPEWLMRVEGLTHPTALPKDDAELYSYSAAQLFVERVRHTDEHFRLTAEARQDIARICAAVEGLPLAVELAAARTKTLKLDEIARQVAQNSATLTTTMRDFEARHRSLSAVLDWSYQLLPRAEQVLFRRLAVFAGGWTREAAEQVCAFESLSERADAPSESAQALADRLNRLVDHSLVVCRRDQNAARYRMLEPVRQYAWQKLSSAEMDLLRTRHLAFFLEFAETSAPKLKSPQVGQQLDRLALENMNLRAALTWALTNSHDAEPGLRLAGALWRFWWMRGMAGEGCAWLKQVLELEPRRPSPARAKALYAQGHLCYFQGDYASARALHAQSAALAEQLAEHAHHASALNGLGNVYFMLGDYDAARQVYAQGLALRRTLGDAWSIANSLHNVAQVARTQGDFESARGTLEECLALNRALGDRRGVAFVLLNLTGCLLEQHDPAAAALAQAECLALFQELDDRWGVAHALEAQGDVLRARGEIRAAAFAYRASAPLFDEMGEKSGLAHTLLGLALAAAEDDPSRAACLFGATEALRQAIGLNFMPLDQLDYERNLARVRAALLNGEFDRAWARGQTLSASQVLAFALEPAAFAATR